jgi:alpha-L-rhamnosidase
MPPDGTINPGQMTSFNHYALGAVADWITAPSAGSHRSSPATPRYHRTAAGGLTWATAGWRRPGAWWRCAGARRVRI